MILCGLVAALASGQANPLHATENTSKSSPLAAAFTPFWNAESDTQREAAIRQILATEASFEEIWGHLTAGRSYSRDVKTGRIDLTNKTSDRVRHHYRVLVPNDYDPSRRYPVRFFLHGGVSRPAWRKGGEWWSRYDAFESPDWISVFPSSWDASMWWHRRQAENVPAILDYLKRTYNLDENRAHMFGISDGATGAYFFAFRDPTPWASFLPFIGHPAVLDNRQMGVDGEMYPRNLAGRPFFVVNGGQDRLYPAARVAPYLKLLHRAGAEIVFRPKPEAGHDTSWWPAEANNIKAFLAAHPRDPLPDRLSWESEDLDRYGRNHWLLITALGTAEGEASLDDFNTLDYPPTLGFQPDPKSTEGIVITKVHRDSIAAAAGLRKGDVIVEAAGSPTRTVEQLASAVGEANTWGKAFEMLVHRGGSQLPLTFRLPAEPPANQVTLAFHHRANSGRIELERRGNVIDVRTQGVRRYKLLLSPQELDFELPITVLTNGRTSFEGRIELDAGTLLRWAATDQDRSMLFAAELEIDV